MTALHDFIAEENDLERLCQLLEGSQFPNSRDRSGRTPLHIAVLKSEKYPEETDELVLVVRELINFGADVNQGNNMEKTPLHFAVSCRNFKIIETLLQSNADINQQDNSGYAALHFATSKRKFRRNSVYDLDLDVVKLLLRYDPELDVQSRRNETPLMFAAQTSNLYIVLELLKKNASVYLKDSHGDSAMHYALNNSEVDVNVVLELKRHGCSFHTPNNSGNTPKNSYFRRLLKNNSRSQVEKAKRVIRLFMLDRYGFNSFEQHCILETNKNHNFQFSPFLDLAYNEILHMHRDKLLKNYSVYNIALRGSFRKVSECYSHIPLVIFDRVLEKLIKRQYPVYFDLIAAGICRPYMKRKFAKMCCSIEIFIEFFDFDILYLLSFYLSHLDMLNIMTAFYQTENRSWILSCLMSFKRCSIS